MEEIDKLHIKKIYFKLRVFIFTLLLSISCSSDPITVDSSNNGSGGNGTGTGLGGSSGGSGGSSGNSSSDLKIDNDLNKLFFLSDGVGFVIGDGIVIKTNDNGDTWSKVKESNKINFTSIYFENSQTGLIGGNDSFYSYLYLTKDGGFTWQEIAKFWYSNDRSENMSAISRNSAQKIIMFNNTYPNSSQTFGKVYTNDNSGQGNWNLSDLNFRSPGIKLAVSHQNFVYVASTPYWTGSTYKTSIFASGYFLNNDISFDENRLDINVEINDLKFTNKYGYFVADGGKIGISSNFQNWTVKPVNTNTSQNLVCIQFINDDIGYILEEGGKLLKTFDAGLNWLEHYNLNNSSLNDFYFFSENKIIVIGNEGFLNILNL